MPTQELGNLHLKNNESLTIQGKTIVINGNIMIEGDAKLTFRDSTIVIKQTYAQQYSLAVSGNATFEIERVTIPTNVDSTWWINWNYYDAAKIIQTEFKYPAAIWQSIGGNASIVSSNSSLTGTFADTSTAKLVAINPDDVWIELMLPKSDQTYEITSPNGQQGVNWNSPARLPYSINIVNASKIKSIDFDLAPGVHVVAKNSNSIRFGRIFYPPRNLNSSHEYEESHATIVGLKNQYYADKIFSAGIGENSSSIRLINSSVYNWWPNVYDGYSLNLDDCVMADPRATDSSVNINNSTMFMYGAYGNSNILIQNSTVENFLIVKDNSVMDLQNVSFFGQVTKDSTAVLRRNGEHYP